MTAFRMLFSLSLRFPYVPFWWGRVPTTITQMGYLALTQARTVRQDPWAKKPPAWGPLRTPASPARPPGRRRGLGQSYHS